MRYIRVLAILGAILVTASFASAQRFSVGIGVGPAYGYYGPDYYGPVCAYGYYPYAPYECAPYGYYGPAWFSDGIFIGAGPWYHGEFYGRSGFRAFRDRDGGFRGGRGFNGGGGGNFHGGGNFRGGGGGGSRGGSNFHGGGGGNFHGSTGGGSHGGGNSHGGGGHSGGHR